MAGTDLFASGAGLDATESVAGTDLFADPNAPGPFKKGLKSSVAGVKGAAGGVLALAGDLTGIDAVKKAGLGVAHDAELEAQPNAMRVEDIDSVSSGIDYLKYGAGYLVPQLATAVAAGVLGRAGGVLAARGIADPAAALLAKNAGMTAGLGVSSIAQEAGSIYPDAVEAGLPDAAARAVVGGTLAGSLDLVPELLAAKMLGFMGKKVANPGKGLSDILGRGVKGAAIGAGAEAATEVGQTAIERASVDKPLDSPEAISDYLNSAALGVVGGGVVGGPVGAISGMGNEAPAAAPATAAPANIPAEAAPAPVAAPEPEQSAFQAAQFQGFPFTADSLRILGAATEPEVEPTQKTRLTDPTIIGEQQPAATEVKPIMTPQEDEMLRLAEGEINAARQGSFKPAETTAVRSGVESSIREGQADQQVASGGKGSTRSVEAQLGLIKKSRGLLLDSTEAKAVREFEASVPPLELVENRARSTTKQFTPQQRRENFSAAYTQGVDKIIDGFAATGTMNPKTATSVKTALKRAVDVAMTQPDAQLAKEAFDERFDKAIKGKLPKGDVETFRKELASHVEAALPQEETQTFYSKASRDIATPDFARAGLPRISRNLVDIRAHQALDTHLKTGGSTISVANGLNMAGAEAYGVSPFKGRELVIPGQPTVDHLKAYIQANDDLLSQPQNALGTWYNTDDGNTYLDVSTTVPRMQDAMKLARESNQLAIFDLRTATVINLGHPLFDLAQQYNADNDMAPIQEIEYIDFDPAVGKQIAGAYEGLKTLNPDPRVKASYDALAKEEEQQFAALSKFIKIETWADEGQAYANSAEMRADVFGKNHLWVFGGGEPHPYRTAEQTFKGRAVHDLFAHARTGFEFGPRGELNATRIHAQMYSELALPALVTDNIGQNAWVNFSAANEGLTPDKRSYAEQKVDLLPESVWRGLLMEPRQKRASAAARQSSILQNKGTQVLDYLESILGKPEGLEVKETNSLTGHVGSMTIKGAKSIIELSTNAKDQLSVAAHEGYHYLEMREMSTAERDVVRRTFQPGNPLFNELVAKAQAYDRANNTHLEDEIVAVPAEARAYAFEFWRRGELTATGVLERAFRAVKRVLERVRNYIDGLGFTSYEDIFLAVEKGQYARYDSQGMNTTAGLFWQESARMSKAAMDQIKSPAFAKWFGDSKVVDANGQPQIVYHGTDFSFDAFENKRSSLVERLFGKDKTTGQFFFAAKPEFANFYATGMWNLDRSGANVMPVYLSIKNPIEMEAFKGESLADAMERAQKTGHDGVIVRNWEERGLKSDIFIALDPKQIKSATGNSGTYDPQNPNILYSRAATQQSLSEMAQRVRNGELPRTQLNALWADAMDSEGQPDGLKDNFLRSAQAELGGAMGSIKRFYANNLASGLNLSRHSVGFNNVFNVLTSYTQRKNRLIADTVERQLSEWTGQQAGTQEDKAAASRALLDRTEHSYSATSPEYLSIREGLTPKQRAMFDQATKMIADRLEAELKADVVSARSLFSNDEQFGTWYTNRAAQVDRLKDEGYFPERRYGDHTVYAYVPSPDTGKNITVYYSQHEREADARTELAELKKTLDGQGLTFEYGFRYKAEYDASISFNQFLDMANRQGVKLSQNEKEKIGKALIAADSTRRNRIFRRKNIAGYSEDGMRVLAEFGVTMANKVAYAELGKGINDALAGKEVNVKFTPQGDVQVDTYDRNLWGMDGEQAGFYRNIADSTVDFVMSPQSRNPVSRGLRTAASLQFLGGSAAAAMVNMTSLPMNTIPWLTQHTSYTDAFGKTLSASKLAGKHLNTIKDLPKLLDESVQMEGIDNVDGLRRALQVAAQDGTILDTEIYQIMGLSRGQEYSLSGRAQKAVSAWMFPFRWAEQFNRVTTFIAAYNIAKQKNLSNDQAYKLAQETVYSTQFRYDEANRPALARGPIGSLLFTFKTYPIFMLETLTHLAKENPRAAVYMTFSILMMAGLEGLPFAEDIEDLIDTIAQRVFNSPFNSKRALKNILKSASEAVTGADLSSVFMHGVANELTGLSFASRVGMGNLIPGSRIGAADADYKRTMSDILGPIGSLIQGTLGGADSLTRGNFSEAARQVLPLAGQNLVKGWEQWSKGFATDIGGRKLVDVDGHHAFWQSLGFSSSGLSNAYDADKIDKQTSAFYTQAKEDFQKDLVKAVREGNVGEVAQVVESVKAWNEANPSMPIAMSPSSVRKQLMLGNMPMNQRTFKLLPRALRAQSESALGIEQ